MKLGALIKSYMKEQNVSLREMASQIGIDHCTVRNMLIGRDINNESFCKVILWLMKPEEK